MKKYFTISFIYALAAIACGVFYREFTKFSGFTGKTTLAFTHLHLFVLGTLLFLIIAILVQLTNVEEQRSFKGFMITWNIGLPFMVVMFLLRGILQVTGAELSNGADAAVSGVSGLAHIIITVSLILLFVALRRSDGVTSLKKQKTSQK